MTTPLEKGLLFSSQMIRALLDGSKRMTRRLVKPQPKQYEGGISFTNFDYRMWASISLEGDHESFKCPHPVGSRIYAKENCWIAKPNFGDRNLNNCTDYEGRGRVVGYSATMTGDSVRCAKDYGVKQSPSIFMPKWAARIWLEVESVKVEKLGSISEEDAVKEGIQSHQAVTSRSQFYVLWESIHGPSAWERDKEKYVWIYEFRRIKL